MSNNNIKTINIDDDLINVNNKNPNIILTNNDTNNDIISSDMILIMNLIWNR